MCLFQKTFPLSYVYANTQKEKKHDLASRLLFLSTAFNSRWEHLQHSYNIDAVRAHFPIRLELSPHFSRLAPFLPSFSTLQSWHWSRASVCPTSKSKTFCMHSNTVSSVSVSVNKPVLYLPVSFLPPDGCPDLCNGNGRCTLGQNSWQCVCQTGWRGPGCNVAMETSCADNKDNEGGEQKSSNSPSLKSRGLSILSS